MNQIPLTMTTTPKKIVNPVDRLESIKLREPDCFLSIDKQFLTKSEADALLQFAIKKLEWEQIHLNVFGNKTPKRKQVSFGNEGLSYAYSGTTAMAKPWPKELLDIRAKLCKYHPKGLAPDFVLGGLYDDGKSYISDHADDETGLMDGAPILSVTVGAERDMIVSRKVYKSKYEPAKKSTKEKERIEVPLPHGSLCIMHGNMQKKYLHGIPKRLRCKLPRVNFTFRYMKK